MKHLYYFLVGATFICFAPQLPGMERSGKEELTEREQQKLEVQRRAQEKKRAAQEERQRRQRMREQEKEEQPRTVSPQMGSSRILDNLVSNLSDLTDRLVDVLTNKISGNPENFLEQDLRQQTIATEIEALVEALSTLKQTSYDPRITTVSQLAQKLQHILTSMTQLLDTSGFAPEQSFRISTQQVRALKKEKANNALPLVADIQEQISDLKKQLGLQSSSSSSSSSSHSQVSDIIDRLTAQGKIIADAKLIRSRLKFRGYTPREQIAQEWLQKEYDNVMPLLEQVQKDYADNYEIVRLADELAVRLQDTAGILYQTLLAKLPESDTHVQAIQKAFGKANEIHHYFKHAFDKKSDDTKTSTL